MSSSFAIVNLRDGIRRDIEPFLINNDSFPTLENAYLFRGRIQRRSCFTSVGNDGRLKGTIGVTAASPFVTVLLDGTFAPGIPEAVASFRIGNVILTDPGGASPVALISTDPLYSGTLDRATGALTINHPVIAPTAVIYVPGLPVMGLRVREQVALNDELLIGFDTRYSYLFDIGTNDFIFQNTFALTLNTFIWTGTDSDLFWSVNYFQAFWATNNIAGFHAAENASLIAERDGIRWYGTLPGPIPPGTSATGWRNFNPQLTTGPNTFLTGGLIILPYKNRLVVLNTLEGANLGATTRFPQRARWCQNGTPFYGDFPDGSSAQVDSWRSDVVGKGSFIDAPTAESIVSAEFIKDTLIVYFERSTWQLVYTGNEVLPFVWQKINTELGTESTFSIVPFDRGVFGVGNYGIITCDSVNVQRIDQKIPDEVFQIQNKNDGVKRVYGIRDYNAQLVYWTFPVNSDEDNEAPSYELTFPNQVLVFNYLDGSWAEFDDCFTCFGYWQRFSDITWAQLNRTWESSNFSWNSGILQARYPDVIAGNQRGFVVVFSQLQQLGQNSPSLPISNINPATRLITAPNHNLVNNQYVLITGVQGTTGINNVIYKVTQATVNTFILDTGTFVGVYTGGGLITHMPNIFIETKQFNPFYEKSDSVRVNYLDIYIDRTTDGEFVSNFYTSSNESVVIESDTILTSPEPNPSFSSNQTRIWHRVFSNVFGSFFQNVFTMNDVQMRDLDITTSDIKIHGLIYQVSPAGRISYDI
jgi:hypothetical protein